jgi:hypothetical protein
MFTAAPLTWERMPDSRTGNPSWQAKDGTLRYRVFRGEGGHWRVQMNGATIGEKYKTPKAAMEYADWGGTPNRMGYDRETGELFE